MICVDSSVWIEVLRDRDSPHARLLAELLDAGEVALPLPVRLELLGGTGLAQRPGLARALSALPRYAPREATWRRIESWLDEATRAGRRFGVFDLLIASIAADHDAALWSLDKEFEAMADLGFVELASAPGS